MSVATIEHPTTAATFGCASAFDVSIETIFACA